jgi:subtilisin family serine protease
MLTVTHPPKWLNSKSGRSSVDVLSSISAFFTADPIDRRSHSLSQSQRKVLRSRSMTSTALPTDQAGNSLTTARNLGTLGALQSFQDGVGAADTDDYYRFTVGQNRLFQLSMMGSGGDAFAELLNGSGQVIASSYNFNNNSEAIARAITAGTYYVRIATFNWSGDTVYDLQLSTAAIIDRAGNHLDHARDLATLTGTQTFTDYVGTLDSDDYYRFRLEQVTDFKLQLDGLLADADVTLRNQAGQFIASSYKDGQQSESIQRLLGSGIYYVQVQSGILSSSDTTYRLRLTADAIPADTAGNSPTTARDLGTLSSVQSFREFVGKSDLDDYYQLNLSQTRTIQLNMSVSDFANVQLLNQSGTVLHSENASSSESPLGGPAKINAYNLAAGTYYVRVSSFSDPGSTYHLSLSAAAPIGDRAGNTLETARSIGTLNGNQNFQETVGDTDTNDYYRFQVNRNSQFYLGLTDVTQPLGVELLNSSGQVIDSAVVGFGANFVSLQETLTAGTYHVRVYPGFPMLKETSGYNLSLTALPTLSGNGFNSTYGYGLINAAAAIARSLGQPIFANVPDLGGQAWGNDLVKAPEAWAKGYTGQNVVVAVVDSGVDYNHSDLSGNIWSNPREIPGNGIDDDSNGYIDDVRGWDFINSDNDPMDDNSHGTHVAGTIAGRNNGVGVTGIAYNAKIMPIKVLSNAGSGSNRQVADGIRYAADNGADVINLSLGSDSDSVEVAAAVRYAHSKGSFVVMAAGNSSGLSPIYPAHHALLWGLAVGAVDRRRQIASFSNRAGSDANMRYIVAPGVEIYSSTPGNRYDFFNGTSMAAPHAAGVAALMLSANPNLTPTQMRGFMINSATRLS